MPATRSRDTVTVTYTAAQLAEILRPHVIEDAKETLAGWEKMHEQFSTLSVGQGITATLYMDIEADKHAEKEYLAEVA